MVEPAPNEPGPDGITPALMPRKELGAEADALLLSPGPRAPGWLLAAALLALIATATLSWGHWQVTIGRRSARGSAAVTLKSAAKLPTHALAFLTPNV